MKGEFDMARPRGTDMARVIQVIETQALRGSGQSGDDPCRIVTQYWDFEGNMLAEHDPCAREGYGIKSKVSISEEQGLRNPNRYTYPIPEEHKAYPVD